MMSDRLLQLESFYREDVENPVLPRVLLGLLICVTIVATAIQLRIGSEISYSQKSNQTSDLKEMPTPLNRIKHKPSILPNKIAKKRVLPLISTPAKTQEYTLIFGSYSAPEPAKKHLKVLAKQGISKVTIKEKVLNDKKFYVVQSLPYQDPMIAKLRSSQLNDQNIQNFVIKI